jgi:hypothetical protein
MSTEMQNLQAQVREAVDGETPLSALEGQIESSGLDHERRSALWLYAWAYETRREMRRRERGGQPRGRVPAAV